MNEPYYFKDSPNDSPRDGTIHPIAQEQLKQWQKLAEEWSTYRSTEKSRPAIRCRKCGQCLWFLTDRTNHPYVYTIQMRQALTVAHIKQNHSEVFDAAH